MYQVSAIWGLNFRPKGPQWSGHFFSIKPSRSTAGVPQGLSYHALSLKKNSFCEMGLLSSAMETKRRNIKRTHGFGRNSRDIYYYIYNVYIYICPNLLFEEDNLIHHWKLGGTNMWTNPHHGKTHLGNSRKLKLVQTYTSSFSPEPCFIWFIVSMVIRL